MSEFKFVLNPEGVKELLKSSGMASCLMDYAKDVRNIAGIGYEVSQFSGPNRLNVSVYANTKKATRDNLKNNTLLKALGSARK